MYQVYDITQGNGLKEYLYVGSNTGTSVTSWIPFTIPSTARMISILAVGGGAGGGGGGASAAATAS